MLTPGIEYFGAVDDAAAQEFVDGNARSAPPLVRADGVGPDVPMSIFGALLTGRSIEELAAEPQLVHLSVESRGEAEIHLFRLPSATARALADADAEQLADVARRSLVYAELAGASPELITGFLAELGDCVRRGRGDLYARIIAPSAPPRVPRLVPALRRALPWVGVGFAGASIAFAVTIPVGLTPLLAVAGLTLSFSVGALLTRRGARRAFDRGQGTRGSIVVRVDADARLLGVLPGILSEVLGDLKLPPPPRRGELHLRADPTGLTLVFESGSVHIPRDRVLGLGAGDAPSPRAGITSGGRVPALVVVLRIDDDESVLCELPLLDLQGGRPPHGEIELIARTMAQLTGARAE